MIFILAMVQAMITHAQITHDSDPDQTMIAQVTVAPQPLQLPTKKKSSKPKAKLVAAKPAPAVAHPEPRASGRALHANCVARNVQRAKRKIPLLVCP